MSMPDSTAPAAEQRSDLDRIDSEILRLTSERLRASAALGDTQPIRAAAEVKLLRRLITESAESVEGDFIIELWRVLIGADMRRKGPVDVSVAGGSPTDTRLFDIARRHFGGRTRIGRVAEPRVALQKAVDNPNAIAVVPWPAQTGPGVWWPTLSESRFHSVRLIAGLPLRGPYESEPEAAVFAAAAPCEPAGEDITIALAYDRYHRATRILAEAGITGREIARSEPTVLFRIQGFVAHDDVRVTTLARGGLDGFRIVGSYARV